MNETGTLESLKKSISLMREEEAFEHIRELRRIRRNRRSEVKEEKHKKNVKAVRVRKKKEIDFAKMSPADREAFIEMARGRIKEDA